MRGTRRTRAALTVRVWRRATDGRASPVSGRRGHTMSGGHARRARDSCRDLPPPATRPRGRRRPFERKKSPHGDNGGVASRCQPEKGATCAERSQERWRLPRWWRRVFFQQGRPRGLPQLVVNALVTSPVGSRQPGRGPMTDRWSFLRRPDQSRCGSSSSGPTMGSRRCESCRSCSAAEALGRTSDTRQRRPRSPRGMLAMLRRLPGAVAG